MCQGASSSLPSLSPAPQALLQFHPWTVRRDHGDHKDRTDVRVCSHPRKAAVSEPSGDKPVLEINIWESPGVWWLQHQL